MGTIVVITTKGRAKKDFVNALYKETGGAVELVCLQKFKKKNLFRRIISFYKKVGFKKLPEEVYYSLVLRLSRRKREILPVVSLHTSISETTKGYIAPTMETDDINSQEVFDVLKKINPDLIVILGGSIVRQGILETAKQCINMHFGVCPYYRGANGMHHAILKNDFENIGITIHYAVPKVDAGEIISIVKVNYCQSPEIFFRQLSDKAIGKYIEVAKKLSNHEKVPSLKQDLSKGKNYLLKEWTFKKRNALAKKLLEWH